MTTPVEWLEEHFDLNPNRTTASSLVTPGVRHVQAMIRLKDDSCSCDDNEECMWEHRGDRMRATFRDEPDVDDEASAA